MAFAAGDGVVYPSHGATVVDRVETIEVLGSSREYSCCTSPTLLSPYGCHRTQPVRSASGDIISAEDADEVFCVLRRRDVRAPSNWSRRFKNHTSMLKSGDVYQLASEPQTAEPAVTRSGLTAGRGV